MLRFINICLVLALVVLAYVTYEGTDKARALDENIDGLLKNIEAERDAVAELNAEWRLLNRPERIASLAQKQLKLAPARPAQLVTLDMVSESDFERIPMEATDESIPAASGRLTKVKSVPAAAPANFDDDLPAPPLAAAPDVPKPAEPKKKHLLAYEQAEADRSAKKTSATAPTPTETKRYFKVKVRDASTLEVGLLPTDTVLIRLEGIKSWEADETCKRQSGTSWPCGAKARTALAHFIRYRAVACTLAPGGESKDFAARCSVLGQDLSTWLVRQGWATPQPGAEPELAKALDAAKTQRLGLWQAE